MKRIAQMTVIGAGFILTLNGCATPAPYGQAESEGGLGYSDRAIEENRFRVTFRARSAEAARDGALRRAAEITLTKGGVWFEITHSYTDEEDRRSGASVGIGGSTGSHHSGVGVGISLPLGGSTRVEHSFEFIIGSGDKPVAADVFDARSVLAREP